MVIVRARASQASRLWPRERTYGRISLRTHGVDLLRHSTEAEDVFVLVKARIVGVHIHDHDRPPFACEVRVDERGELAVTEARNALAGCHQTRFHRGAGAGESRDSGRRTRLALAKLLHALAKDHETLVDTAGFFGSLTASTRVVDPFTSSQVDDRKPARCRTDTHIARCTCVLANDLYGKDAVRAARTSVRQSAEHCTILGTAAGQLAGLRGVPYPNLAQPCRVRALGLWVIFQGERPAVQRQRPACSSAISAVGHGCDAPIRSAYTR